MGLLQNEVMPSLLRLKSIFLFLFCGYLRLMHVYDE
jgi:hypothetical protein